VVTPRSVHASLTPKIASSASSTPSKVLTVAPGGTARAVTRATPFGCVTPAGSELGDAIEAIMLAVRAWVLRFGPEHAGAWERAVCLTGGLLWGRPAQPP